MTQYQLTQVYLEALFGSLLDRVRGDERGAVTAEQIVLIGAAVVGAGSSADHLAEDAGRRQQHPDAVTDERGVAAAIVLFPMFAAAVFMFVNGRVAARPAGGDRGRRSGVAGGRPLRLVGRCGRASPSRRWQSAGIDDISVSISRGADFTTVSVSGRSPGLLSGMTVTVRATSVTPTEGLDGREAALACRDDHAATPDVAALIVIVPLAFGAVMLFIYAGRQGTAREGVTHAAAVAARAASMERDAGSAQAAAAAAAARRSPPPARPVPADRASPCRPASGQLEASSRCR